MKAVTSVNIFEDKVKLQSSGLCRGTTTVEAFRKTGAGPAGMSCLILPANVCANIPTAPKICEKSPYSLFEIEGKLYIKGLHPEPMQIIKVPVPKFYFLNTSKGNVMWKVAMLHGIDCIGTTIDPNCYYWKINRPCKFCGIEIPLKTRRSIGRKDPDELVEVLIEAKKEGVCSHVTLTSGSAKDPDNEVDQLATFVKYVKDKIEIPLHIQIMPPKDLEKMSSLIEAGADTIGLHVETLDSYTYAKMCPGKANDVKIDYYYKAWKEAVDIFGESQVSTFIILGLGESEQSTLNGIEKLVRLGCVPFIVSFTPIIGSKLENHFPPSTEYMQKMYRNIASILRDYGLDIIKNKAGCVRCGACNAIYESLYMDRYIKI